MSVPLSIEGLTVAYGDQPSLHDVSLHVPAGKILALVGESGSGKSTLAHAAARLLPPGARITNGSIRVGDTDMAALAGTELRAARGHIVAYLPQDALAALNPVMRVGRQIAEVFTGSSRSDAVEQAVEMLRRVSIRDPGQVARKYSHELSGGMRQRVMIAIALAHRPQLLIADEPTTALDVTVQAEVLELVAELQRDTGVTVVWITHDLSVVREIADTVAVLYGGRVAETCAADEVFEAARHPYTHGLLGSFGGARTAAPKERFTAIPGSPPLRGGVPGCPFHPRCTRAEDRCRHEVPLLLGGVACHVVARTGSGTGEAEVTA